MKKRNDSNCLRKIKRRAGLSGAIFVLILMLGIPAISIDGVYAEKATTLEAGTGSLKSGEAVRRNYKDIKVGYWGKEAIDEMSELGYFKGYTDGTFKPDREISYNEFVKLLISVLTGEDLKPADGGDWASGFVKRAEKLNIVLAYEYDDKDFNEAIPRRYMAVLLDRMIKRCRVIVDLNAEKYNKTASKIKDLKTGKENEFEIVQAFYAGIIKGNEKGEFRPDKSMSRAEAAQVLSRFIHAEREDGAVLGKGSEIPPERQMKTDDPIKEFEFQPDTEWKHIGREYSEEEKNAIATSRFKPELYTVLDYDPRMRFKLLGVDDDGCIMTVGGRRLISLIKDGKVVPGAGRASYSEKSDDTLFTIRADIYKIDYIAFSAPERPDRFTWVRNPFRK